MDKQGKLMSYCSTEPFSLESGGELPGIEIGYHTYGKLNSKRDNCVWVCHALTANSDVADWWPHTVVPEGFLDPNKYFIVCANIIGSCYGSTGPMSINKETGEPWYGDFPRLTIRDMVKAHILLANHLNLKKIYSLIGSSVGGFQAIEWAITEPWRFDSMVLIATAAYATPWTIAIDETQRMAIFADKSYGEKHKDAGKDGLAAARALALLTYRGGKGYNLTQQDQEDNSGNVPDYHRACSYQKHQGDKLVRRFDAYSYITIINAFDTHNVGRGRDGISQALQFVEFPVLCVGITTDLIFTPEEMRDLSIMFPRSRYKEISSQFGHDGFLVEHSLLNTIIKDFFKSLPVKPLPPEEEEPEKVVKEGKPRTRRSTKKVNLEDPHPQLPTTPNLPIP